MSYQLSIQGHGVDSAEVKRVFETAVRDLRAATSDGGSKPTGTAWGDNYSQSAADVEDEESTENEAGDASSGGD